MPANVKSSNPGSRIGYSVVSVSSVYNFSINFFLSLFHYLYNPLTPSPVIPSSYLWNLQNTSTTNHLPFVTTPKINILPSRTMLPYLSIIVVESFLFPYYLLFEARSKNMHFCMEHKICIFYVQKCWKGIVYLSNTFIRISKNRPSYNGIKKHNRNLYSNS